MKTYKGHYTIIEKKNGMYSFPSKNAETGKKYIDLSKCNCLDDIVSCILDEDVKELEIECGKGVMVLVKALSEELLRNDDQIKILWVVDAMAAPWTCKLNNGDVLIVPNNTFVQPDNSCSFKEIAELLHEDHQRIEDAYIDIVNNAFCLMLTGKYPNSYNYSKANHVYIANRSLLDTVDLHKYMDLNSIIFLPLSEYDEKTHRLWKERYYNNIHYIDSEKIYLDMVGTEINWSMKGYSDFITDNENGNVDKRPCYLYLKESQDLHGLLADLKHFAKTGKVRNHRFYLINECSWANRCSFLYQKRFSLREDCSLSICGGTSCVNYSLFDDEYDQFASREKMIEQAQIKNGCKSCAVHAYCTKCIYRLEGFEENVFCKIMKEHLEIQDFINMKNALIILERFGKMILSFNLNEITFANYSHSLLLPSHMKGKKPITFNAYLFEYDGKYYCFNPVKGKIFQIGVYLAFILEAIQKGYDFDETERAFHEKWKHILEEKSFSLAWDKVNSNILH